MTRGRWTLLLVATALVAAGAVFAWTQLLVHRERDVAVPPTDASPAAVVRAYLDALDAHDCDTAVALWTPDPYFDVEGSCRSTESVTHVWASGETPEADTSTATVDVRFDMTPRWWSRDFSLEGPTTWRYGLVREGPGAPWRLVDSGMG